MSAFSRFGRRLKQEKTARRFGGVAASSLSLFPKTPVFATETYTLPFYLSAKLKRYQNSFHNQNFKNNPFNEFWNTGLRHWKVTSFSSTTSLGHYLEARSRVSGRVRTSATSSSTAALTTSSTLPSLINAQHLLPTPMLEKKICQKTLQSILRGLVHWASVIYFVCHGKSCPGRNS